AALSAFAASAACAVAASLLTPTERPALFGTDSTPPVPVTVTLRPDGAEPRAKSGLPTPTNATAAATAAATSPILTSFIVFLPVRVPGRYAAALGGRHVRRSRRRTASRRGRSDTAASRRALSASPGG